MGNMKTEFVATEFASTWTGEELAGILNATHDLVKRDLEEHAETGKFYSADEGTTGAALELAANGDELKAVAVLVAEYATDPDMLQSIAEDLEYGEVTAERRSALETLAEGMVVMRDALLE